MLIAIYILIIAALAFHVFISPLVKLDAENKIPLKYYILNIALIIGIAIALIIAIGKSDPINNFGQRNAVFILGGLVTVALVFVLDVLYFRTRYLKYRVESQRLQHLKEPRLLLMLEEAEEKLQLSQEVQSSAAAENSKLSGLKTNLEELQNKVQRERNELDAVVQAKVFERTNQIALEEKAKYNSQVEALQQSYGQKMEAYMQRMEQRFHAEKEQVISDVFSFDEKEQDDIFELKRKKQALSKKEEEIEKNKFLLDVDQKVSEASKHVLEAKSSALDIKSENVDLRADMRIMSSEFKSDLQKEQFEREKSTQSLEHGLESQNLKLQGEMKSMASEFKSDLQKEQYEREKSDQSLQHGLESQNQKLQGEMKSMANEFKGDLQKEQFEREKSNQGLQHGLESQNLKLQGEMKGMSSEFKSDLQKEQFAREKSNQALQHGLEMEALKRTSDYKDIENKLALLGEQMRSKITELSSLFSNQLKDMELKTMNSFRQIREDMSDFKLQFGQEILRLDKQQGQILTELEKYYAKNQTFVNQMQSLALEAKNQNLEGEKLLLKVNQMHQQHRIESKEIENKMNLSLEKISVQEGRLANSVGESVLKLKNISDQQHIAMRDLALEQKGADLLWREKGIEHDMNLQKVDFEKKDLDRLKQMHQKEASNFQQSKSNMLDNMKLNHQLFMQEQRYVGALQKANSSGGILSRIARGIEGAMSS